ncbi:MAG: hypothetical protein LQ341_002954 [Variospora aurantia]|nr:MAG: hypothetical protein LQ341_002954 [Variospora aurantia]
MPFSIPAAANDDIQVLVIMILVPAVVVACALNLWLGFARPWEYYGDDARYVASEQEDWLLTASDVDENISVAPWAYRGVKEGPLSPEEVTRLIKIIRSDQKALEAATTASSPGRKRKAGDEASPVEAASAGEGSVSPRSRKLKIDTDVSVWVGGMRDYGSCFQGKDSAGGKSNWVEYPFTFRASHPDRKIKPALGHRR